MMNKIFFPEDREGQSRRRTQTEQELETAVSTRCVLKSQGPVDWDEQSG